MTQAASRLKINDHGGITAVEFIDKNILDETNIQQIGEEIGRLVDAQANPRLLISFRNVDHLSSAALGTLITINNRVSAKEGQLRLSDIEGQIFEVFKITKLDRLFEINDTAAEAIKAFD